MAQWNSPLSKTYNRVTYKGSYSFITERVQITESTSSGTVTPYAVQKLAGIYKLASITNLKGDNIALQIGCRYRKAGQAAPK